MARHNSRWQNLFKRLNNGWFTGLRLHDVLVSIDIKSQWALNRSRRINIFRRRKLNRISHFCYANEFETLIDQNIGSHRQLSVVFDQSSDLVLQYTLANDIAAHMLPISSSPLIRQIMHIQCRSVVGVDGFVTASSCEVSWQSSEFGMR